MADDKDWDQRLDSLLERFREIEAEAIEEIDYLDLDKDYHEAVMGITRDEFGRFITKEQDTKEVNTPPVVTNKGWYQDKEGKLYHYDGVIWDIVPEAKVVNLEHLG
jgi:hypothetical protein